MGIDWQPLAIVLGSVSAAVATVIVGIITGRNNRRRDQTETENQRASAAFQRDKAEQDASRARIEEIARDAVEVRKRLRETEDEYERRTRELRAYGQRGWDLASYHFSITSTVVHLLNNIFQVAEIESSGPLLLNIVRTSYSRFQTLRVPISLEDFGSSRSTRPPPPSPPPTADRT